MKNKKKLVHIISSLKQGGAESLIIDMINHLDGFDHHVIYFHDGQNRERLQNLGIATYHVHGLVHLYDLFFLVQLWRLVNRLKPDCIHSSLWVANLAARFLARILHIPLVSVVHLGVNNLGKKQDGTVRTMIDWATFRLSQRVVAVSQGIADHLQKCAWIPAERITVITNGIDVKSVQEEALRGLVTNADLGFDDDTVVIGSVARFIASKNHQLLMRSFASVAQECEQARLVLIGFGPLELELRLLSQRLGIKEKVSFEIGKRAYGYYPLFDCFVLSSYQEGISIALLEAMCFSLPCIVTNPDRMHEVIIHEHNGLLVPSNNEHALAEALKNLLKDAIMRRMLGAEAFKTVNEKFCVENMIEKYKAIFNAEVSRR
jgi:glycosyltransferase involved in cell wall biosynthesis